MIIAPQCQYLDKIAFFSLVVLVFPEIAVFVLSAFVH